jgi:hypothetical protein
MLTPIDEYTRESLAIRVARKLGSYDVIEALADVMLFRRIPEHIRSDERIYREEGLTLQQRRKRRRRVAEHRRERFHPTGRTRCGRWTLLRTSWQTGEGSER